MGLQPKPFSFGVPARETASIKTSIKAMYFTIEITLLFIILLGEINGSP